MHKNPFLPEDHWKNKSRLEAIEKVKQREAEKQQKKVQDSVEYLYKRLSK